MPDGTPGGQQAQDNMGQWIDRRRPVPTIPGPFGGFAQIGATIQNLIAAAGAGQIAVAPDIGQAINKQLVEVQKQVDELRRSVVAAAANPQFGGGYAERVSTFVQGVAAGGASLSAEDILAKFHDEVEQLKGAVAQSMGNYGTHEARSTQGFNSARGQS